MPLRQLQETSDGPIPVGISGPNRAGAKESWGPGRSPGRPPYSRWMGLTRYLLKNPINKLDHTAIGKSKHAHDFLYVHIYG